MKLVHGSICSGFGGFDLAAEWMQWENRFHCEINEFCKTILNYYWPAADSLDNLKETSFKKYANTVDILTGGIPCQPFSSSGKGKGTNDARHLWPEMYRAIQEIKPKFVVVENVRGLVTWSKGMVFKKIQTDLEAQGYEVLPVLLPIAGIGGDHQRYRIFIVANSLSVGLKNVSNEKNTSRKTQQNSIWNWTEAKRRKQKTVKLDSSSNPFNEFRNRYSQPPIFSMDDGLPFELDGITVPKWIQESLSATGNTISPHLAYYIFKSIEETLKI